MSFHLRLSCFLPSLSFHYLPQTETKISEPSVFLLFDSTFSLRLALSLPFPTLSLSSRALKNENVKLENKHEGRETGTHPTAPHLLFQALLNRLFLLLLLSFNGIRHLFKTLFRVAMSYIFFKSKVDVKADM